MGLQTENFVGNPHKQEYGEDGEELEYLSGDEIDFNPFGLPPGDPDLLLDDNYDIVTDDDYDPEDDYEDFLSDSDYEYDGSDASEETGSDNDQEELPAATADAQESSSKAGTDNKSENKLTAMETLPSTVDDVSSNEADADT